MTSEHTDTVHGLTIPEQQRSDQHDGDQHDKDQHDAVRKDDAVEQDTRPAHDETAAGSASTADEPRERLVPQDHATSYGSRWDAVKGMFVDEPREAVAQADALVGELLDELERLFRDQRRSIEQGLDTDETSTEDLRVALRRYRSFFDRLLAV